MVKLKLRGNRLATKFHLTRWGIVALAVVVALTSIGITYAGIKGPKKPGDDIVYPGPVVPITSCSDPFTWVVSNDDGVVDNIPPYGDIDPGDDGIDSVYDRWGAESSADPSAPPPILPDPPDPLLLGQTCDRYNKDVAKTFASLGQPTDDPPYSNPQYITVKIENAYPSYHPTVFFALECPDSAEGHITGIELIGVPSEALDVTHSGIYIGQPVPSGGEVVGALHVHVKQDAEQNVTYTFTLSITTVCEPSACGTAYAYGGLDIATCFFDIECLNKPPWGWTNGPLEPLEPGEEYEFEIWASAANCDTSKGRLVGTVTIEYDGSTAVVTYDMYPGNFMTTTHLYIGSDPVPTRNNNKCTVSPGQYGNTHIDLDYVGFDTFTVYGLSGEIHVIAHAVVCWFE